MGAPLNPSLPSHERDGPRDVPSGVERPRRGEVIHQHERHTQGPTGTPILTHTPRLADRPYLETPLPSKDVISVVRISEFPDIRDSRTRSRPNRYIPGYPPAYPGIPG